MAVAEAECVCIRETRHGANEFKLPRRELLRAIISKFLNHRVLARHDFGEIKIDIGTNSPRVRMTREMHHFGRVQERFRGHAAAENTQPAKFAPTFDDGGFETCSSRGAGG